MKKIIFGLSILTSGVILTGCSNAQAETKVEGAAFDYREIYLPLFSDHENDKLKLNTIDADWGLWGHNLEKVVPENPSKTIYAQIDGDPEFDQYCFTSNHLFEYICDYIDSRYDDSDSVNIAILPNDNDIVCLCKECVSEGNTEGNASPAVFNMIEKLAKKYPNITFFTSYYLTTSQLPDRKLPANTGVLVSAMDYPLSTSASKEEEKFKKILEEWNGKTSKVYVWDYINNFDDYFTPFPVFSIMQRRLKLYRDAGVSGVFLNGSGSDYSTFSRIKKHVLSKQLINPDLDWRELVKTTCKELYPAAGQRIADFLIAQEDMVISQGKNLPLYDGVATAIKTYLPQKEFVDFYNDLQDIKLKAEGQERLELQDMSNAMSMTMLELKRINNDLSDTDHLRERLQRMTSKGVSVYNESCWGIGQYLDNYQYMINNAKETEGKNLLKGVKLIPRTPLDEDYTDITIVTDGLLGIPSNYHDGNLISSADPSLSINIPHQPGMNKVRVWMVYNPAYKIGMPAEVYLSSGGLKYETKVPEKPANNSGHTYLDFNVPPGGGDLVVTLVKDPEVKTMAIDEIQGFAE